MENRKYDWILWRKWRLNEYLIGIMQYPWAVKLRSMSNSFSIQWQQHYAVCYGTYFLYVPFVSINQIHINGIKLMASFPYRQKFQWPYIEHSICIHFPNCRQCWMQFCNLTTSTNQKHKLLSFYFLFFFSDVQQVFDRWCA